MLSVNVLIRPGHSCLITSKETGLDNVCVKTFPLSSEGLHQFMRVWLDQASLMVT